MSYITSFHVKGKCIPEAFEKSVLKVWEEGIDIPTEYDNNDPPSKDATVMVEIENPFNEPRLHKNFPGGFEELEVYRQEVCYGIHDHWINPEEDRWSYTYSERLFKYAPFEDLMKRNKNPSPFNPVNQMDYIVEKLSQSPYSRRAQATTWMPTCDTKVYDCPCLQRLFLRMPYDAENDLYVLNMNSHWRSRDLFKAWIMNVYAITDLQRIIAEKIENKIQKKVIVGRYVDISDSLHLYGSYFDEIKPFIEKIKDGEYEKRSFRTDDENFVFMTNETKEKLKKDIDFSKKGNY